MSEKFDFDKAAEAEPGVIAVRSGVPIRQSSEPNPNPRLTPAQARALEKMAQTFLEVARENGAEQKRVVLGDISLDLEKNGSEEILFIRTTKAAAYFFGMANPDRANTFLPSAFTPNFRRRQTPPVAN